MAGRPSLLLAGGVVLFAAVGACLWLLVAHRSPPAVERASVAIAPSSAPSPPPRVVAKAAATPVASETRIRRGPLEPYEVLGNIECTMVEASRVDDIALVMLPTEDGARFSVVDSEGTALWDDVPFEPHYYGLGKQEDGTLVVGLADLRLGSKTFRPMDSPEPLRVYVGEVAVYETAKAWDFAVAGDGSSFAVHEPYGGGASRLVVHDLASGEERHFDLGTGKSRTNAYEADYMLDYTLDGREVVFTPAHADAQGIGDYAFYPVGDGRTKGVTVENSLSAVLVSSAEGYFVDRPADLQPDDQGHVWEVAKRRFDAASGTVEDVWRHRLRLGRFDGTMFVSDDGRWLGLDSWNLHVLDTETGDVAFSYPTVQRSEQLARLASLGEDASPADLGPIGSIWFRGDTMRFLRTFGNNMNCATPVGEEYDRTRYRRCVRYNRNRGRYREVVDVYDLNALAMDAQPAYRTATYRHEGGCVASTLPSRGLQSVDGKLAYLGG